MTTQDKSVQPNGVLRRSPGPAAPFDWVKAKIVALWALWPIAIFTAVHKVWFSFNEHPTDDFSTVWNALLRFRDGVPVYSEDYSTVDPHYLYFPGGTLLLSPLSFAPSFNIGRALYIGANAAAIVLALTILTYIFTKTRIPQARWKDAASSVVLPISILLVFNTESVRNTLLFSNVNGVLLFLEVLFIWLFIARKGALSGLALGLAITIKPQFLSLLFIPLAKRQWSTIAYGLAVPIAFNLAAWPLMARPSGFWDALIPYLGTVRDFANSSIPGLGAYFGVSPAIIWIWRIFAAILVAVGTLALLKWRNTNELMWVATTTALLLTGVFLVSSLGQMYYSMLLAPLLFTVMLPKSTMHNPVAWIGVYLCLSGDIWTSDRWVWPGKVFEYSRGTIGWMLLLIAITFTVLMWFINERNAGSSNGSWKYPGQQPC